MTRDNQMMYHLIQAKHKILYYEKKPDTKSSFYQVAGQTNILPQRLSFISYDGNQNHRKAFFQINGKYKIGEFGLYFNMNNREVHSKIMPIEDYLGFIGWGEIDQRFKRFDLLIIESDNNCRESFSIHFFEGLAKPEYLNAVCQYLKKKQRP